MLHSITARLAGTIACGAGKAIVEQFVIPMIHCVPRRHSEDDITLQIDQPLYAMSNPGQNRIVWQGAQGSYNALATGGYNYNRDIIRNKSPWGPDVFDGCKPSRNGEMERTRKVTDGILGF